MLETYWKFPGRVFHFPMISGDWLVGCSREKGNERRPIILMDYTRAFKSKISPEIAP
jgi:hypothetical protein